MSRVTVNRRESESALVSANQRYWQNESNKSFRSFSHWRGFGPFVDDTLWLSLGRSHLDIFERAVSYLDMPGTLDRVVEWGCGGGLNAVHFAPTSREYYGVDISAASLDECARQLAKIQCNSFVPVLISAPDPDLVFDTVTEPVDLFLCTYVFELIPSPDYGLQIVRIAHRLLRPDGIAIVQIRYNTGVPEEMSKLKDYDSQVPLMTTYSIHEFWIECERIGFRPALIKLLPEQPELNEVRYAYFVLVRTGDTSEHAKRATPTG